MPIIRRKDERKGFTILGKFGGGQPQPIDYSKEYFFIEDISGEENVLTIRKPTSGTTYVNVSVSTDKVNWFDLGSTESGNLTYTIPANGKLYVRGNNAKWSDINGNIRNNSNSMYCSKPHNVCGNIMSLLYGDDFAEATELNRGALSYLFDYNQKLQQANNLILPATTLASYCYNFMFYGCTSLTQAPALPATKLTDYCYYYMFDGCTSLTEAPALPATTLASSCYRYMFQNCTSLATAPALPATKLTDYCYSYMFRGCTSLTEAPALPATTLASYCYRNMFSGCTSLTTAPALPATTLASYCYTSMFSACTSLTTAPALPATTLTDYCYNNMFSACKSLTTAPALSATTLANSCYQSMFDNCTALTTAPALPATTLASSCYRDMFRYCTSLNKVVTYANDISASNCLYGWLSNVSTTGDFYNLGGAEYSRGVSGIPTGWTEHTTLE